MLTQRNPGALPNDEGSQAPGDRQAACRMLNHRPNLDGAVPMRVDSHRNGVGDRCPRTASPRNGARNERSSKWKGRIVCGVDGSADSQAALAVASDLAARLQLRLIMVNVVEPSQVPYAGVASVGGTMPRPSLSITEQQQEAGTRLLVELSATMGTRTGGPTRCHRLSRRAARRPRRRRRSSNDRCGFPWPRRIQGGLPRQRLHHVDWRCTLPGTGRASRSC